MDPIVIFLVIPFAIVVFSIALQKIFDNPILVSAIIISIIMLYVFLTTFPTATTIIYIILYGLISLITAYLTNIFSNWNFRNSNCCNNRNINRRNYY